MKTQTTHQVCKNLYKVRKIQKKNQTQKQEKNPQNSHKNQQKQKQHKNQQKPKRNFIKIIKIIKNPTKINKNEKILQIFKNYFYIHDHLKIFPPKIGTAEIRMSWQHLRGVENAHGAHQILKCKQTSSRHIERSV